MQRTLTRILIYNSPGNSKIGSLLPLLRQTLFKNTGVQIETVTEKDLTHALKSRVDLFILPGAKEGTSYREQLKGAHFDRIKEKMSNGMNVLGICAGGYVLSKEFSYDFYNGDGTIQKSKHIRSELGIAAAKAFGPDLALYTTPPNETHDPLQLYGVVDIDFETEGQSLQTKLTLSKGPSFKDMNTEQCESIATYNETGHAAIIAFKHGKGRGILSGPAIEISPVEQNPNHLAQHQTWAQLWSVLIKKLLPQSPPLHIQVTRNLGLASVSAPRSSRTKPKL